MSKDKHGSYNTGLNRNIRFIDKDGKVFDVDRLGVDQFDCIAYGFDRYE